MDGIISDTIEYPGEASRIPAYLARPDTEEARPAVIVIHEIFGLNEHIRDVANRFAGQGYVALAPHLYARPELAEVFTPDGLRATMEFMAALDPKRRSDTAYVQQELSKLPEPKRTAVQRAFATMFGGMPKDRLAQDLTKAVDYLNAQSFVRAGKVGSVGFCFGGGMSLSLACHARLAACVVFYGENPAPIELVDNIACPVLGLYGAEDLRINQHLDRLVKAMVDYRRDFEMRIYPGAGHAFFNDTNPPTYRDAAAREAWERVLSFYRRTLQV